MTVTRLTGLTAILILLAASGAGCAASGGDVGGRLRVVAAENFWGSIASQMGGSRVDVRSIVVNQNTDPHSYQPSAQDARVMAGAGLAMVNGIGYDDWGASLLEAGPAAGRVVLNVGDLLGLREGDNPHRWYFPANVRSVIGQIVAGYDRLDPNDSGYFARRREAFETRDLARYDQLRREIRSSYAGVP